MESPQVSETSQPADGQILESISVTLQGSYLSNEYEKLLVKAYSVLEIYKANEDEGYHLDSLNLDIQKDSIKVIERTAEFMKVKLDEEFILDIRIEGDSAYFNFEVLDVIFSINQGDVLIKKGDYYYFNARQKKGDFKIRRVRFDHTDLIMENLMERDSIRVLPGIPADSTTSNLNITTSQFELLERVGFKPKKRYTKIHE